MSLIISVLQIFLGTCHAFPVRTGFPRNRADWEIVRPSLRWNEGFILRSLSSNLQNVVELWKWGSQCTTGRKTGHSILLVLHARYSFHRDLFGNCCLWRCRDVHRCRRNSERGPTQCCKNRPDNCFRPVVELDHFSNWNHITLQLSLSIQ